MTKAHLVHRSQEDLGQEPDVPARDALRAASPAVEPDLAWSFVQTPVASPSGPVQLFRVENDAAKGTTHVTKNGLYRLTPGSGTLWVRDGAPAPSYCVATGQRAGGYSGYIPADNFHADCLHTAEEVMAQGRLRQGQVRSTAGRGMPFGDTEPDNWAAVERTRSAYRDKNATPAVGGAYATVAPQPVDIGGGEMCQYHAGAVVARDENDSITLEVFGDTGGATQRNTDGVFQIYGSGQTFHDAWEPTFGGDAGTIAIRLI